MNGQNTTTASVAASSPRSLIRPRIANACDGCKQRKSKCDGQQPCTYCIRRQREDTCHYTPQRRTRRCQVQPRQTITRSSRSSTTRYNSLDDEPLTAVDETTPAVADVVTPVATRQPLMMDASPDDDTEVPREGRLLSDAQGKLIFIGDCAPLSLFQSVRQLVTRYVGQNAFAPETSRYSVLENAAVESSPYLAAHGLPQVQPSNIGQAVANFISSKTGLIDLFDNARLTDDILIWANLNQKPQDLTSTINYLILAIGCQKVDEASSQIYFDYARDQAWRSLSGNLSVGTSQAFVLMTIYMLCSCQINNAFIVFGVAVRAAHSIGIHRTEVNARFGPEIHRQRDRLWKSLRVVDLFLSTSMGRPPATSDVDCTVPYRVQDEDGNEEFDLLNASVQILLIVEGIVLEIYSRKKISLQLTEGVSHQLREWSTRWLPKLKDTTAQTLNHSQADMAGACRVLSSYYYGVMLVSRPFLMYELCRRLSDGATTTTRSSALVSGKSKLADACIDAASMMTDTILDLIERRVLNGREPLIISWLFASSLVLGVGLLGGFGRILEKYTRMSIQALEHFAQVDTHARQYSLIAQSLLATALEYLEKRELQERNRRTESSSQLFGLMPHDSSASPGPSRNPSMQAPNTLTPMALGSDSLEKPYPSPLQVSQPANSTNFGDLDSAFLGMTESFMPTPDGEFWTTFFQGADGDQGSTNLFPLVEAGGGIDLAHFI